MTEKVITESFLRKLFLNGAPETFCLEEGQIMTPAATQFLNEKKVCLFSDKVAVKRSIGTSSKTDIIAAKGYVAVADGKEYSVKPEHLTHLIDNQLVPKDHPRIVFRGKLDRFQAEVLLLQKKVSCRGDLALTEGLDELLTRARSIMRAEVVGETLTDCDFLGLKEKEVRERSHNPQKYFGVKHLVPSVEMDPVVLSLNSLRTLVREVEISAVTAFAKDPWPERIDIVQALNRLSSVIYVLMLRTVQTKETGRDKDSRIIEDLVENVLTKLGESEHSIPVELSARHVHLSASDVQSLFGCKLTQSRELSQPGQYLCRERVCLIGPGGRLDNVAVLGPAREHTQVEVSMTDARILGVSPPVRQSGDTEGAPGIQIATERDTVALEEGLLVPGRHIHMRPEDALAFGVRDKEFVRVRVGKARSLVFENVLVRINASYRLAMHIDFDEGNACGWAPDSTGYLLNDDL